MMLGKYFKKTVFRKEHTADGVVPEAPQGILKKCNACKGAIFTEDVKRNLYICPKCGNYFRVHAYRRIEFFLDDGSFEEWDQGMTAGNPLGFPGYEEKVPLGKLLPAEIAMRGEGDEALAAGDFVCVLGRGADAGGDCFSDADGEDVGGAEKTQ